MPDRFGPRGVIALFIPQQNANMQPEYEAMRPEGVSNQIYRFDISDHERVREAVLDAVPGTLGCRPDRIICGNSLEMRLWSQEKQRDYRSQLAGLAGDVPVVTATDALFVLRAAVGTETCALCVCDTNGSGTITASDALVALNFAVGQPIELMCPPCS